MQHVTFWFQNELIPKLSSDSKPESQAVDTDSRILDAYINQCTAEAQEGIEKLLELLEVMSPGPHVGEGRGIIYYQSTAICLHRLCILLAVCDGILYLVFVDSLTIFL